MLVRGSTMDGIGQQTLSFPAFLPSQVRNLKDPAARSMAARIQRLPVQTSLISEPIMTGCVMPTKSNKDLPPVLLLHGFDSSCLEWRNTFPKLEETNIECWALDILGWGFSDLVAVPRVDVIAKREHMYEFWRTYIQKPMILVGSSLGGAVAIDFTVAHPEAISKLVLVNAQGYAEGTGKMASFPRFLAYLGVYVLKSVLLRTYANMIAYHSVPWHSILDQMKVGQLHCLMPGWVDASVDFMMSGGYNVASFVSKINKETLVIWGKEDKILPKDTPEKFKKDLQSAKLVYIDNCGHLPHVEMPETVAMLISEFSKV